MKSRTGPARMSAEMFTDTVWLYQDSFRHKVPEGHWIDPLFPPQYFPHHREEVGPLEEDQRKPCKCKEAAWNHEKEPCPWSQMPWIGRLVLL